MTSSRALIGQLATSYRWLHAELALEQGFDPLRVGVLRADLQGVEVLAGDAYAIVLCATRPANESGVPLFADLTSIMLRFDRGWPKNSGID